ncbi:hypothetical protein ACYG9R_19440 [Mesorhizobium sp. RSR565B]|nr:MULTISPECIES: hypothetical protein [unclassified Mesorhizobium]ESY08606.1 hypothetical protein X753_00235 [Mesorhizobium sp. LNJC399B00]ESY24316.1 hypothetical protein X750_09440 [Mesorhizobium sp. LNJC394B00]ESZ43643.1 hypothetical protein X730_27645 [Mesorhizobium sp. L103C565B0]
MPHERLDVTQRAVVAATMLALCIGGIEPAWSSDHFDSPAMTANPQADIADVYAWTAPDGRRLNLVMTVVGHSLSDRLQYVLHIDSGKTFGHTTASTTITCRFPTPKLASCKLGNSDRVDGDASNIGGLRSRNGRFQLFAGLRDDPFYNNVKGSISAYGVGLAAMKGGSAPPDAAGCPQLDAKATKAVADQWRHTDGGPATNLLGNWTASAIVVSVDLDAISAGGSILAVWGSAATSKRLLDRMGRPFVGNTLLGVSPFSTDDASGDEREKFNEVGVKGGGTFETRIEGSLAFQDSLDGECGNQLLAEKMPASPARYRALAKMFADDRLWVNSAVRECKQFLAVELAALAGRTAYRADCGGRSPVYDTPNMWRSLLVQGTTNEIAWDGLLGDEHRPSATDFPFLAPPDPKGVDH